MSAVLLDVGGTLWPETPPPTPFDRDAFLAPRLRQVMPSWTGDVIAAFIHAPLPGFESGPAQDVDGALCTFAAKLGFTLPRQEARRVRRALCIPALGHIELFPGAEGLLRSVKARGHRALLISNGTVRDGNAYLQDFADFGLARCLDTAIVSIDVGFLKPHPAVFQAALDAAGCGARGCAILGNSEANDIVPGKELGMFAIRVCIEEPRAESSVADAVVTSLPEATAVLAGWSARLNA